MVSILKKVTSYSYDIPKAVEWAIQDNQRHAFLKIDTIAFHEYVKGVQSGPMRLEFVTVNETTERHAAIARDLSKFLDLEDNDDAESN
jgi:hypothetical protein